MADLKQHQRHNSKVLKKPHHSRNHPLWVKLFAGIVCILLVIIIGLAWNHLKTPETAQAQRESQDFTQSSPDIPLYVLVVGVDEQTPSQANFIGLAAINKEKKVIDFIMLPDNTKIEGRKEKGNQMLKDIYAEGGLSLTHAVMEDIFKIPVPYYISFTPSTFTRMIDMIGGFDLYVEKPMYHEHADGTVDFNLGQGYQHLTGAEASGYMRYLDGDGEISRTQRQERFVKAFYEDGIQHFGITNMFRIYRIWNYVDSNISSKDMAKLAWTFHNVPVDAIHFYIIPGESGVDTESKTHNQDLMWNYDPVEVQKIIGTTNNSIANE